jgi:hypothetical protein
MKRKFIDNFANDLDFYCFCLLAAIYLIDNFASCYNGIRDAFNLIL